MDPVSSSTSSRSVPLPSAAFDPPAPPDVAAAKLDVGPMYGARIIGDAVQTSIITIQALADLGIGAKVNHLA